MTPKYLYKYVCAWSYLSLLSIFILEIIQFFVYKDFIHVIWRYPHLENSTFVKISLVKRIGKHKLTWTVGFSGLWDLVRCFRSLLLFLFQFHKSVESEYQFSTLITTK